MVGDQFWAIVIDDPCYSAPDFFSRFGLTKKPYTLHPTPQPDPSDRK
jgi:hypothetical protein